MTFAFYFRPHPDLLPWEKEELPGILGLAEVCSANPIARIFMETAKDSPSPGGEGRGEVGRSNHFRATAPHGTEAVTLAQVPGVLTPK
jgi:hypothetical protein